LLQALSAKRFGVALAFDRSADGKHVLAIEQEFEMERPSRMVPGFKVRGETLRFASIGGLAVIVSSGALTQ
jgi:predicted PhzF superfamily epimerase YddE/YHI9